MIKGVEMVGIGNEFVEGGIGTDDTIVDVLFAFEVPRKTEILYIVDNLLIVGGTGNSDQYCSNRAYSVGTSFSDEWFEVHALLVGDSSVTGNVHSQFSSIIPEPLIKRTSVSIVLIHQ